MAGVVVVLGLVVLEHQNPSSPKPADEIWASRALRGLGPQVGEPKRGLATGRGRGAHREVLSSEADRPGEVTVELEAAAAVAVTETLK
jgi:hypothetical protein